LSKGCACCGNRIIVGCIGEAERGKRIALWQTAFSAA
jgi:hypothetical protein